MISQVLSAVESFFFENSQFYLCQENLIAGKKIITAMAAFFWTSRNNPLKVLTATNYIETKRFSDSKYIN